MTEIPDVPDLSYFTLDELFEEIRKRGCEIDFDRPDASRPPTVRVEAGGNQEPVEKWMQVAIELDRIDMYTETAQVGILVHCVRALFDLLQPPSVREAR